MSKLGPTTVGELLAELEQDPAYVQRQQDILARLNGNSPEYDSAAKGLLADLAEVGFGPRKVSDLAKRGVGDKRALPALLHWLPRITYVPLKTDVIAALGSPWAKPDAIRPLLEEFHRVDIATDPPDGLRWSIGDALEHIADDRVVDDFITIANDERHGVARALIVLALGRMKGSRDRVVPILLDLLDDSDVCGYAVMALGKLKAREARPALERLEPEQDWVRAEIKKALARIPA